MGTFVTCPLPAVIGMFDDPLSNPEQFSKELMERLETSLTDFTDAEEEISQHWGSHGFSERWKRNSGLVGSLIALYAHAQISTCVSCADRDMLRELFSMIAPIYLHLQRELTTQGSRKKSDIWRPLEIAKAIFHASAARIFQ